MDKKTLKLKTREHLVSLNSHIRAAIKAREKYQARAAELQKQQGPMYSAEYVNGMIDKARAEYQAARAALWPKVSAELDALQGTLRELHSTLDLTNPALVNAVTLIRQAGKGLTPDSVHAINAQFSGDQAALKLLQSTYKDAGLNHDGGLDRQLYDADSAVTAAAYYASAAFQREGSLNTFSAQLSQIAGLEGHSDLGERVPDPAGWFENAARGAGLTVNADGSIESK